MIDFNADQRFQMYNKGVLVDDEINLSALDDYMFAQISSKSGLTTKTMNTIGQMGGANEVSQSERGIQW